MAATARVEFICTSGDLTVKLVNGWFVERAGTGYGSDCPRRHFILLVALLPFGPERRPLSRKTRKAKERVGLPKFRGDRHGQEVVCREPELQR